MSCNCCPNGHIEIECGQGAEYTSYRFPFDMVASDPDTYWSLPLNLGGHLNGTYVIKTGSSIPGISVSNKVVSPNLLSFNCECFECPFFDPTTCPCSTFPTTDVVGTTPELADMNDVCYGVYSVYDLAPCLSSPAGSWRAKSRPGQGSSVTQYSIMLTSNCIAVVGAPLYECDLGQGYPGPWYRIVLTISGGSSYAKAGLGNGQVSGATLNARYEVNVPRFKQINESITLYRTSNPTYNKCCPINPFPPGGCLCPSSPSMDAVLADYTALPETITITRAG